jgi:transketolase
LKPLDGECLIESARKTGKVLSVEEHTTLGGLGGAIAEILAQHAPAPMRMLGIQDRFPESGDWIAMLRKYGISVEHIEAAARELVARSSS